MTARGVVGPIVALSGTPGTGKSTVAAALRARGHAVLDLKQYVGDARFDEGPDAAHHDAHVMDEAALDGFLAEHLADEVEGKTDGPVFIDSHFAHHLAVADRVLVLRCRPSVLRERLAARGWPEAKVRENVEAEALDLIAQEALAEQDDAEAAGGSLPIGEIDTTERSAEEVARLVETLATAEPTNLEIGTVDWSGEVLGWY